MHPLRLVLNKQRKKYSIRNLKKAYLFIALGLLLLVIGLIIYLYRELPSPKNLTDSENFPVSSQIFDRHGQLLYEIYAEENRIPINIDEVPDYVWQAAVSIEDKNFYHHHGLDMSGLLRAWLRNVQSGSVQGGSTITQQLVKNALLSNEKTYERKIKEALLSLMTELIYSKDEILEMYLNYISYGGTAVGIEAAANRYFGKHAKDLNLAEASLLAGLPQAPTTYSPFGANPERGKARQKDVLRRMVEDKYIDEAQAEEAASTPLTFAISKTDIKAPHFVFYIKDLLIAEYGEKMVETGGLRITTTLDLNLQEAAQASLSAEVNKLQNLRVGNGAALVVKPNTGEILAMVGSRDYFDSARDGQVNVTLASRQPGSSIKPIMYASAFQAKTINPGTMLLDIPTCFKVTGQKDYCPKNYSGGFSGPVTIRRALANSLNIPAVKALATIGVDQFIDQAVKMGISSWTDKSRYGLSLTLGGGEVKMTELAEAFAVLANQGVRVPLTGILEVRDYKGQIISQYDMQKTKDALSWLQENELAEEAEGLRRVMSRAPAYLTNHILQDNQARSAAFGTNSQLVIKNRIVSAKTGTTNDLKDNWTVGYTPEFLTIAWVGNNDNKPMSYVASGVTGAAPIWNDIMSFILQDQEATWPDRPSDVKQGSVCMTGMPSVMGLGAPTTGQIDVEATDPISTCADGAQELYWTESQPSFAGSFSKETWVRASTGLPPQLNEEADDLNLEQHKFYYDPLTSLYCSDCQRAVAEDGQTVFEKYYVKDTL